MSKIPREKFPYVYTVDTEYQSLPGEQHKPVSLVAHGFNKAGGEKLRLFFDRPHESPFTDPDNTLLICYNAPSELKTMLALGWKLPAHGIDLYVEFLNAINGVYRGPNSLRELGTGLVDAVALYEGNPMDYWASNKDEERDYIIKNGVVPPEGVSLEAHQERILRYNEEDVLATNYLGRKMMPDIDVEQALWRYRYCRAHSYYEHNGIPLNRERFDLIDTQSLKLKLEIAQKIEDAHKYGVYAIEGKETTKKKPQPVFKMKNFAALLESHGITVGRGCAWRATPTGDPMLEDDYFEGMCVAYPFLEPLRQCRKSLNSLSRFKSNAVGEDGFNRATLWMFGTVTGRNNPKARDFLLSRPHWVRNLLSPGGAA